MPGRSFPVLFALFSQSLLSDPFHSPALAMGCANYRADSTRWAYERAPTLFIATANFPLQDQHTGPYCPGW
jgi:hypothetical protein